MNLRKRPGKKLPVFSLPHGKKMTGLESYDVKINLI
ncbi:addiction module toxin, GnsA/GnsB family [Escherichia coli]|nr:addiction module toxin, GnsA/GnsB family [Escherichia coli]MCW7199464.1 addiction module toxin, GnsA/GnsB family [Escherichia coli]